MKRRKVKEKYKIKINEIENFILIECKNSKDLEEAENHLRTTDFFEEENKINKKSKMNIN